MSDLGTEFDRDDEYRFETERLIRKVHGISSTLRQCTDDARRGCVDLLTIFERVKNALWHHGLVIERYRMIHRTGEYPDPVDIMQS